MSFAIGLFAFTATASAHTVQICWKDNGGVTTFYAGTYHDPSEGPSPVGDIIVDGFNYPFSGFILPAALPADVQCFTCGGSIPAVVHYQTFTSGFALASHSISFDSSTVVQSPWCTFPDQTFGGGACADADFDGLCNDVDPCPLDAANDGDSDGLCADVDNCPLVANADQADANNNGQGDVCEGVVCGNGLTTPPEECDDGNIAGGDGCSAICTNETSCGDGTTQMGEACDDGNTLNGDCCSADCQMLASLGAPCDLDGDFCTTDVCDAAGSCGFIANVSCQAVAPPCEGGETCNPSSGACDPLPDASASTPCEADADLCTIDACDGAGTCAFASDVTCQAAVPPCEGGEVCNSDTGACDALPDASTGTGCEADANLCTNDQCNGGGGCVLFSTVTCSALDQCHVAGTCNPSDGVCSNPNKPNGQACDDGNICTQLDQCISGACSGNTTGADTDADGYCDLFENQVGCDPEDDREIPPQAPTYGGKGSNRANVLVTFSGPKGSRIDVASDPSCATAGLCGPPPLGFVSGFCEAGRIGDPCNNDAECNLPASTCRLVVIYADVPDLVLDHAFLNRRANAIPGFTPARAGCSRKVDVALDATRSTNRVRIKAEGTVFGRFGKDRDAFRYR